MYFVISAGGTAGHINPAIAVADELRCQGHRVQFIGTPDHLEAELAKNAGYDFVGLDVSGFDRAHPTSIVKAIGSTRKATDKCCDMFMGDTPDAVIGFGAYVSLPAGRAARNLGIPLIIHEQNSVPGIANTYLSKKATVIACAYQEAADTFNRPNTIIVGNPIRKDFSNVSKEHARAALDIPENAFVILAMGGSLGAQHINRALAEVKDEMLGIEDVHIIHSTGTKDYDEAVSSLALTEEESKHWKVLPYIDDMANALSASDLAISRAGASSIAEIMTIGIPSIMIPYPFARGDHQKKNARECQDKNAAILIDDAVLNGKILLNTVKELVDSRSKLDIMTENAKLMSGHDSRRKMADIAVKTAKKKIG